MWILSPHDLLLAKEAIQSSLRIQFFNDRVAGIDQPLLVI
jgi:hypothetical protein